VTRRGKGPEKVPTFARGVEVQVARKAFSGSGAVGRDLSLRFRPRLPKRLAGRALVLEIAGTGDDQA
jgi:hypothetical protein